MPEMQKHAASKKQSTPVVDPNERRKMIEEAAYYRSSQRTSAGDPLEDWLAAEEEVDQILKDRQSKKEKEELAAFEKLQDELGRKLKTIKGSIKVDTFTRALDKTAQEVKDKGQFTSEAINKGYEALKKDIARNIEKLGGKWQKMSNKTAGHFSIWSKRSVNFLKQAGDATDQWLKQLSEKISPHFYRSGEIASAGTFICKSCGQALQLKETGHLPRCPQCDNTEFKLKR
jgi:gas vesicle protein